MRRETVKTSRGPAHFMFMDASEIAGAAKKHVRWMNHQQDIQRGNMRGCSNEEFGRLVTTGDESLVKQSEELLNQIEDQVPVSRGWRNVDDVVGAIPNVPAFLAGHPQCMRRRERASRDNAPLTIYMNLSSSMAIGKDLILKRGVTLLALIRCLLNHRSVELWVGSTIGESGKMATAAWRIDTAPLDLARASFQIADTSMSRLFGYAMCEAQTDCHLGGFGFDIFEKDGALLKNVTGWSELLYLPAIYWNDPLVVDPVNWLKRTLKQYIGEAS